MINYEMKRSIFNSFPELNEKINSDNRVNYVYPHSMKRSKILATQLHPNGNGYVIGKYIEEEVINEKGYQVDPRGWIKIKGFTQIQLREIILIALKSLKDDAIESNELTPIALNDVSPISVDETEGRSFGNLVDSCLFNWLATAKRIHQFGL